VASGFEIDGERYPVPSFDTLTLDEAQVLYDFSGLAIEDFVSPDPDATEEEKQAHEKAILERVKNPAFKSALAAIAYMRGHPEVDAKRAREIVGKVTLLEIAQGLVDEEDAASPPASEPTSTLDASSPRSSPGSNESSGSFDGEAALVEPDDLLASTGAGR
jgi:hypothetical protein